ncbi:class I SAM-dependent methyltransferase [Rubellicoccus peritrichatus]|uniref:Class I SAM-dependent methyltransferase n=1 Tax=Rubellicoccus peritrichatus TaxID=3080537 RepID=A0AAQ3QVY6_9BACT|nr:class I SAM-dependent methyltransferase [Puniceicoccus sp. CR14]WOO41385.1 class I SAM-dependent methyltransferase [Puniceicoccus sp. CR14]
MHQTTKGTEGYENAVNRFIQVSQALDFKETNKDFLDHLPPIPARILDLGAGAGQNAAALAKMGYVVTAVEPMADFLNASRQTYSKYDIEWFNDSLPLIRCLGTKEGQFDFILIDGVWHHLNEIERVKALERLSFLLVGGGKCAISLRNGPPGMGTHVFPTDLDRTIGQAKEYGLRDVLQLDNQPSIFSYKVGVTWGRVVLQKDF